jgi:hypothetical protein
LTSNEEIGIKLSFITDILTADENLLKESNRCLIIFTPRLASSWPDRRYLLWIPACVKELGIFILTICGSTDLRFLINRAEIVF